MTVGDALAIGASTLSKAGIENSAREARILMAACLGIELGRVTLHLRDPLEAVPEAVFFADIHERGERRIPMSHILGGREFFGRWFEVSSAVLDPRPDTEALIAAALEHPFRELLDLGTGSGAIAITLLAECPTATGIATDLSATALEIAQRNADALGVADRLALLEGSWFETVAGQFDLIVSNPPYIGLDEMPGLVPELSHEPRMALTDEADGLSAYRIITTGAPAHLTTGGRLMVEIGWKQGPDVRAMFEEAGFSDVAIHPDLDGRDRVVSGVWR